MNEKIIIALDAMGGDFGPSVVVPAALGMMVNNRFLHLILVGNKDILEAEIKKHKKIDANANITIKHASQCVAMDELPSQALRGKKDSSMRVAINLVKSGDAHACVSAGNTGALMATARFVLKTLPGIDRPAIITALPTMNGQTHMLDLGANVDSSAENLFEFAVMGSALTSAVENIDQPKLGLLNIGEEEIKGNECVKEAARLLANSDLNYIGFIEADAINKGEVDVIVCDGFIGNVSLKTTEGVAKMISHYMKQEFRKNWITRLAGLMVLPILKSFKAKIDPRHYNGASFVGLQGIVIKSHGGADELAFKTAINEAILEVKKNVPQLISKQLEYYLTQRQAV